MGNRLPTDMAHIHEETACHGQPVRLHVYTVLTNDYLGKLNQFTRDTLDSGGVFHAAVEVYGACEWSFGATNRGTGVYSSSPRADEQHTFRETVEMGFTSMSEEEYRKVLAEMMHDWQGPDYNVLNRNCCSFADELLQKLGVRHRMR